MDGIWERVWRARTMDLWRGFSPILAEVSETIVSLATNPRVAQLPFVGYSNQMEMMIIPTVFEHTRSREPLSRTEAAAERTQQALAKLRKSVAEKTEENRVLRGEIVTKDRTIRQLQRELDLATGKTRLSPSEGGPSEK